MNKKDKPLDDDEDRKNPQFIPKKGYFYEHDDRTKVEEENGEKPEEPVVKEEKPKKPADSVNKWSHDKFEETEQAPKSSEELQTLYGYDIRSEDQPPRARRRRRYGRGPTKYTRQWEDEEAYQKPRGGYRGRGVGRGNFRGGNRDRRQNSREEYDEDFPELGDSTTKINKIEPSEAKPVNNSKPSATSASAPFPKRSSDKEQQPQPPRQEQTKRGSGGDERGSRDNNGPPIRRDRDVRPNARDYDRENDSYSSRGGGRGGGAGGRGGGNSRRGRRNEFTNRNRYPNRRDYRDDAEYNEVSSNSNTNNSSRQGEGGRSSNNNRASYNNSYEGGGRDGGGGRDRDYSGRDRDYGGGRDRDYGGPKSRPDNNRRGDHHNQSRTIVNGTSNDSRQKPFVNDGKQEKAQQQTQPQQHRIPPFTNTEYPAPGKAGSNVNNRTANNSGPNTSRTINDRQNSSYSEVVDDRHSREPNEGGEPQKEVRDLREKLNAMRMQKGYQGPPTDRRSQIPPRLQQQQQQQQQQQLDPATSKPRRYSTQRERPVQQQQAIVTSGGMVIPNTVAPSIAHGVPNVVPVVTMADGVVPSTVAAFQPPTYYEGTQVYEASASPVTGSGPSVSPSLWTPHATAYAAAPYPSPPTAQVPQVPQPPYGDPTAFIGPGGPAIYAAPPQFLQDPTIINYSGPAPPFPPPYHAHPQGFQGYAQVTPAPPPEVYHGGVTYYSTQNQIQRPPMMAPQKRPKSVLQLVEPPEKSKLDKGPTKDSQHFEHQSELVGMNPIPENSSEAELSKKMEEASLEPRESVERKPSPHREEISWAEEMELTSPTSIYPEGNHFGVQKEESNKQPKQPPPEKEVVVVPPSPPPSEASNNSVNHAAATAAASEPPKDAANKVSTTTPTEEKEPVSSTE
ncbi:Protein CASC3 [Orchesella cincta]|uniref:Protein CASC3 n=1 Tax=Orchesella cincta TaxID=48709 RepID=A0A1D2NIX3_ORCCI|nr:Protein CASC3 [Orchesella cincta]